MDILYVNNNDVILRINTVSALEVDPSGALARLPGSPTDGYPTGGRGTTGISLGGRTIAHFRSQKHFLYVANQGDHTISTFSINPNGSLNLLGSPVPAAIDLTSSGSLAINPDRVLYVGGMNGISSFRINPNGSLTFVSTVLTPTVAGLALGRSGNFLVASMVWANELRVFYTGRPGFLFQAALVSGLPTPAGLDSTRGTQAAQELFFVGSYTQTLPKPPPPPVSVFEMDRVTGALTQVPGSPFSFDSGRGSAFLRLSPNGKLLFVANNWSRSVTPLRVSPTGQLTPVRPRQPFPVASNSPQTVHTMSAIERDESGKFVFTGNVGLDVGAFRVLTTGKLIPVPGSPFATGNANDDAWQTGMVFVRR